MAYLLEDNLRRYLELKGEEEKQREFYTKAEATWKALNEKTILLEKGDPTYFGVGQNIPERYINLDGQTIRISYRSDYKITSISIINIEDL